MELLGDEYAQVAGYTTEQRPLYGEEHAARFLSELRRLAAEE